MTNRMISRKFFQICFRKYRTNMTFIFYNVQSHLITCDNACTFLTPMLQCMQPIVRQVTGMVDIVHTKDTTLFIQLTLIDHSYFRHPQTPLNDGKFPDRHPEHDPDPYGNDLYPVFPWSFYPKSDSCPD